MSRKRKHVPLHKTFVFRLAVVAIVIIGLSLVSGLVGCAGMPYPFDKPPPKQVESQQPIPVMPEAPATIRQRYQPREIPEWVAPDHPDASSCLKAEGEDQQRQNMLEEQRIRQRARQWANGGVI